MAPRLILTFLLAWMAFTAQAQSAIIYDDTISVQLQKDTTIQHSYHDVVVSYNDNWYTVEFYPYRSDTSRPYQVRIQAKDMYDKVSYAWQSDNQVVIRFFDSESNFSMRFKVWGVGKSTGVEILKD